MWANRLLGAGAFLTFFAGYLFMKDTASNSAQLTFRVGLLAVGSCLFLAGLVMKATGKEDR